MSGGGTFQMYTFKSVQTFFALTIDSGLVRHKTTTYRQILDVLF